MATAEFQEKDSGIDWEERCHTLEVSLEKFRLQALRIREALGDQVGDHFHILCIAEGIGQNWNLTNRWTVLSLLFKWIFYFFNN